MNDAQQRQKDGVHYANHAKHHPGHTHRQPMLALDDRELDRMLQVGLRGGEIRLGNEIRQDMMRKRLAVRFSRLTLDTGGFEFFRLGERVDGHSVRSTAERARVGLGLAGERIGVLDDGRFNGLLDLVECEARTAANRLWANAAIRAGLSRAAFDLSVYRLRSTRDLYMRDFGGRNN